MFGLTNFTVGEIIDMLKAEDALTAHDVALPQEWVDDVREVFEEDWEFVHGEITPHFVWSYEDSVFGFPRPITPRGRAILREYNARRGTRYETSVTVVNPGNHEVVEGGVRLDWETRDDAYKRGADPQS